MKTTLVIFGITGDLSQRKLLPALSHIEASGLDISVVGVSRREVDRDELLARYPELANRTTIFSMDLAEAPEYLRLKDLLASYNSDQTLFYMAVPPGAAAGIVDFLGEAGLNGPNDKILFEKPFGFDTISAEDFIQRTARYYHEANIYRIDHYMAKEVAQALIALRGNVENHQHHWNKDSIKAIDIIAAETIGVEGRGQFYEQTGALRDFLQGHLMQLLSLVLMRIPTDFSFEQLPVLRAQALSYIEPADPARALRGQYEGYGNEVGNPGSLTETFASVEISSNDPQWQGVVMRLSTGKALDRKETSVTVHYNDGTKDVFNEADLTGSASLDAYERVLLEAVAGNEALFTTSPEIIRSWEILATVQQAWGLNNEPIDSYTPGSAFDELVARAVTT